MSELQSLLSELKAVEKRCPGKVTFFHSTKVGSWAECGTCKHKFFEGDQDYQAVLDAAQATGKVQQCEQERPSTIPARVKLLEKIVEVLCQTE